MIVKPVQTDQDLLLQTVNITKAFEGTIAVKNVDFGISRGQVVAIVGENGAGKTTLKNLLIGLLKPDSGKIIIDGSEVSNYRAADYGIAAVHQEFSLFPSLSVSENICIVNSPGTAGFINWRKIHDTASEFLQMIGANLDIYNSVENLSTGEQQLVEIAKALRQASKILILDEPTTSLTKPERDSLFRIIRRLKSTGIGIVFISHFIDEVFEIADKVVVLRDGHHVGGGDIREISRKQLEELMVGRSIDDRRIDIGTPSSEIILKVENISYKTKVKNVNFELHKGEVLGFSGLMGAGRTELVESIFGLRKAKGNIWLDGKLITNLSPNLLIENGIAFVPEDRRRNGLFIIRSLKENLTIVALKNLVKRKIKGIGFIGEKESAEKLAETYRIVHSDIEKEINFLSGGNQQKALLARWLSIKPRICILDEPTRGVDIGAKEEIHSLIGQLARQGTAVILVSSELPELMLLSHRIIILRKGQNVAELSKEEFDPLKIVSYIAASSD